MQTARLQKIKLFANAPGQLRNFYKRVFDFQELEFLSEPPDLFVMNGNGCQLYLKRASSLDQLEHPQGIELCFEVEDLVQTINRIKEQGGNIILTEPASSAETAFYAIDPAGYHLMVECVFRESSIYF